MNKVYTLDDCLRRDLAKLYNTIDEMNKKDKSFVEGVGRWSSQSGKITHKQLVVLGRIFKRYLQDGEYFHHNWSIWRESKRAKAS